MCGLVGIFESRGRRPIDGGLLKSMNDRISHRGPDGDGEHIAPGIGLGHRRLAIIDLGGGHQPMFNEDGKVAVVFNGEIYNYKPLVTELEAAGHVFRSHCDTEVIVHAWEEWGPDCVTRFRGMFAFALWDEGSETLFLARDHLGKKPLYWSAQPDGRVKLAAGWLIEQAGWKGRNLGAAGMYEKQALVLVNRGGATGADVLALMQAVQRDVHARFGIALTPEPIFL